LHNNAGNKIQFFRIGRPWDDIAVEFMVYFSAVPVAALLNRRRLASVSIACTDAGHRPDSPEPTKLYLIYVINIAFILICIPACGSRQVYPAIRRGAFHWKNPLTPLKILTFMCPIATIITVPEELRKPLGERGAEALVGIFQQYGEANKEDVIRASKDSFEKALLHTKSRLEVALTQAKGDLEGKMAHLELRIEEKLGVIKGEMGQLEGRLESKIAGVEGRLESKIAQTVAQSQSTLIKWLFSLTMAQTTAVIIAILLK